tara:strand:+ start:2894 stop:3790 length:897 start_codon:yes stop_codon:yes gene_type:complete
MAQYKPNALEQLFAVLPSLIGQYSQIKLGQDRLEADDQRFKKQMDYNKEQAMLNRQAQKNLKEDEFEFRRGERTDSQAFTLKENEKTRELNQFNAERTHALNLLRQQSQDQRDLNNQLNANKNRETDLEKTYMLIQGREKATDKQIDANRVLRKEMVNLEDEVKSKRAIETGMKAPLRNFIQESNILKQSGDLFVDEDYMIQQYEGMPAEGFLSQGKMPMSLAMGLANEVTRFQNAKVGTPEYKDKLMLLDRLIQLQNAFSTKAFTEDGYFTSGKSTDAIGGKRIVDDLDNLISRLKR